MLAITIEITKFFHKSLAELPHTFAEEKFKTCFAWVLGSEYWRKARIFFVCLVYYKINLGLDKQDYLV